MRPDSLLRPPVAFGRRVLAVAMLVTGTAGGYREGEGASQVGETKIAPVDIFVNR